MANPGNSDKGFDEAGNRPVIVAASEDNAELPLRKQVTDDSLDQGANIKDHVAPGDSLGQSSRAKGENSESPLKKQRTGDSLDGICKGEAQLALHGQKASDEENSKAHLKKHSSSNSLDDISRSKNQLALHDEKASSEGNAELPLKKQGTYDSLDEGAKIEDHVALGDSLGESSRGKASDEENSEPPPMKQHTGDLLDEIRSGKVKYVLQFENGPTDSELEEMEKDDWDLDSDEEEEEDKACSRTDQQLLDLPRRNWRAVDKWNLPEVYNVLVDTPRCEKSECLDILKVIGCGNRFLGCSVETKTVFFANLNKDEAERLKAVKKVRSLIAHRYCIGDL